MPESIRNNGDFVFLLTTFNRVSTTLRCLCSIESQVPNFQAVVVDDNSIDGTPKYIADFFPNVHILSTAGNYYWAAGMKLAQDLALEIFSESKQFFFVNDDVILEKETIQRMLSLGEKYPDSVIVASLVDPVSSVVTYGGLMKRGFHPLKYKLSNVVSSPIEVEAFHGNLILIPKGVLLKVGGIDGEFQHAFADFDLALRLRKLGTNAILLPPNVYRDWETDRKSTRLNSSHRL